MTKFSKEVLDRLWTEATTPAHWFPSSADPDSGPVCLIEPYLLQDIVRALREYVNDIVTPDFIEKAKDRRYSNEWVGMAFRARLDWVENTDPAHDDISRSS